MARVRLSVVLFSSLLVGCAAEQAKAPSITAQQVNEPAAKGNILACTGLPMQGQKCGLELPKLD